MCPTQASWLSWSAAYSWSRACGRQEPCTLQREQGLTYGGSSDAPNTQRIQLYTRRPTRAGDSSLLQPYPGGGSLKPQPHQSPSSVPFTRGSWGLALPVPACAKPDSPAGALTRSWCWEGARSQWRCLVPQPGVAKVPPQVKSVPLFAMSCLSTCHSHCINKS